MNTKILGNINSNLSNVGQQAEDRVAQILQLGRHGAALARMRSKKRTVKTEKIKQEMITETLQHQDELRNRRSSILPDAILNLHKHIIRNPFNFLSRNFKYQVSPDAKELDPELEKAIEEAAEVEEEQEEEEEGLEPKEIFFLTCLIFSLFFADVWDYENFAEEYTIVRNIIILVLMVIFFIEITLACFEDHFYFGGTFFWLDVLGTLVLLLELSWIFAFIASGGSVTILRATRASKIGVRSKEIFRLMIGSIKMLRAIRPLFAATLRGYDIHWFDEKHVEKDAKKLTKEQLIIRDDIEGKKIEITEAFAFRIAGIVMVLIIVVPFLQVNLNDTSPNAWITNLQMIGSSNTTTQSDVDNMIDHLKGFYEHSDTQLFALKYACPWINETIEHEYATRYSVVKEENIIDYFAHYSVPNSVLLSSTNPYALKYVKDINCLDCSTKFDIEIRLDSTKYAILGASFSMVASALVILVLFFGTSTITTSMEKLILNPLKEALLTLSNEAWGTAEPDRLEKIEEREEDEEKGDAPIHPAEHHPQGSIVPASNEHRHIDV